VAATATNLPYANELNNSLPTSNDAQSSTSSGSMASDDNLSLSSLSMASSTTGEDEHSSNLRENLRLLCINHNLTHAAIRDILKLLNPMHAHLPTDPRTLLQSPGVICLADVEPGQYYHFGVK
jgi:hypothetical protein